MNKKTSGWTAPPDGMPEPPPQKTIEELEDEYDGAIEMPFRIEIRMTKSWLEAGFMIDAEGDKPGLAFKAASINLQAEPSTASKIAFEELVKNLAADLVNEMTQQINPGFETHVHFNEVEKGLRSDVSESPTGKSDQ